MRFKIHKKERIPYETVTREVFAWHPISIGNECRWLERVKILGYWWEGSITGAWYWESIEFID